jgi:quaternary ammonium compound-resistance protein SugE
MCQIVNFDFAPKADVIPFGYHCDRARESRNLLQNCNSGGTASPTIGTHVRDDPALSKKESHMAWITLVVAGLLEVVWAFSMKQSAGFSKLMPTAITIVAMIASFGLLSFSMRTLPLGTAYTVWTGIGAIGAFLVGITILGEQLNVIRMIAAALIVCGLVLMKTSASN